mgnify:CR=1 FL=1
MNVIIIIIIIIIIIVIINMMGDGYWNFYSRLVEKVQVGSRI